MAEGNTMMKVTQVLPIAAQIQIESRTVVIETLAKASNKSFEFALNFPQFVSYDHEEHMLFINAEIKPFIDTHTVLEIEAQIQSRSLKTVDMVRNASQFLTDEQLESNVLGFTERDLALAKYIRFISNTAYQSALNEGW